MTYHGEEPPGLCGGALERACGGGLTGRPGGVDGCGLVRAAGAGARRGRVRAAWDPGRCVGSTARARSAGGQRAGHADGARFPGRASPADPSDQRSLATYKPPVRCSWGRRVRSLHCYCSSPCRWGRRPVESCPVAMPPNTRFTNSTRSNDFPERSCPRLMFLWLSVFASDEFVPQSPAPSRLQVLPTGGY